MSKKESTGMLKVALMASAMTGVVFVGGGYFAVKMLQQADEGAAVPQPPAPPVVKETPAEPEVAVDQDVPAIGGEKTGRVQAEVDENALSPEAQELIETLRRENDLKIAEGEADMNAAGTIGYIPQITPDIVNSEDALAAFAEQVPGLSSIIQTPVTDGVGDFPEANDAFTGVASVVTPGVISVGGQVLNISGIISPDVSDICVGADGVEFSCGSWAVGAWSAAVQGRTVHCLVLEDSEGSTPNARCEMEAGNILVDIGSWAVTAGVALADQDDDVHYLSEEGVATQSANGLWSSGFDFGGVQNEAPEVVEAPDALGPEVDVQDDEIEDLMDEAEAAVEEIPEDVVEAISDEAAEDPGPAPELDISSTIDTIEDIPDRVDEATEELNEAVEDAAEAVDDAIQEDDQE
ncbi:MAG: hypothetical protein ABJN42_20410 [Roseibium sp.]|uniref:hypothetical protein n=1 Tax=Roseibium sp. TaxID=1936156 RepID=UPI003297731A